MSDNSRPFWFKVTTSGYKGRKAFTITLLVGSLVEENGLDASPEMEKTRETLPFAIRAVQRATGKAEDRN
jgi:hypothetical protein